MLRVHRSGRGLKCLKDRFLVKDVCGAAGQNPFAERGTPHTAYTLRTTDPNLSYKNPYNCKVCINLTSRISCVWKLPNTDLFHFSQITVCALINSALSIPVLKQGMATKLDKIQLSSRMIHINNLSWLSVPRLPLLDQSPGISALCAPAAILFRGTAQQEIIEYLA